MKDWVVRTIKTFVQSFFGILIPEACVILGGGFPETIESVWLIISPILAASLSAAICAAWNVVNEYLKNGESKN